MLSAVRVIVVAFAMWSSAAFAQSCNGQFQPGQVCGNPAGSQAPPGGTSSPVLGLQGTTQGALTLANTASGAFSTVIKSSNLSTAGWTLTLPPTAGTNGYALTTNGSGVTAWTSAASLVVLTVNATPTSGFTAGQVMYSDGSKLQAYGITGTAGSVVLSNSPTLVTPTLGVATGTSLALGGATISSNALAVTGTSLFGGAVTLGAQQTTQGTIVLSNTAAGAFATTIQSSNSASAAWTLTLPVTAGTNNYVLTTNGSGVTAWTAVSSIGVSTFSAGTTGFTPNSATSGAITLAGTLVVANGGTNCSSASITCFNNITGFSAAGTTGTTSTNLVFSTSPTLVTPAIGVATGTSLALGGATIGTNALAVTGTTALSSTLTSAAHTITSASANSLAVGLNGATNPAFNVDASTASQAAGLDIVGAATGGTVAIKTIDSGNNNNLTINAKGSGTIGIGSVSTGAVTVTPNAVFSGTITAASLSTPGSIAGSLCATSAGVFIYYASNNCFAASATSITVGTTTIGGGTASTILYQNGASPTGTLGEVSGVTSNGTAMTFANGDLILSGSSSGASILEAPATGGGTVTFFAGSDTTAGLATAQTFTAAQTFTNSDLKLLGSSTGANTFTAQNSSSSNYSTYIPAATGALGFVGPPQGRLTLVTGTPVMTANETGKSEIFYDCFAGNQVPVYNGTSDVVLLIISCEINTTMQSSSTGVTNANGVFDVWAVNVSNVLTLCVATNGSGGGWASDTGGSNTARGSGYSQLDISTRSYTTNANSITHCYNGSTDEGSISANRATYLGTIITDAGSAGVTSFTPANAAASNCTAGRMGVWNAYNRVSVASTWGDSTSSWSQSSTATWRETHGQTTCNTVTVLGQNTDATDVIEMIAGTPGSAGGLICGIGIDSTTSPSGIYVVNEGATSALLNATCSYTGYPGVGLHTIASLEYAIGATATWYGSSSGGQSGATIKLRM